MKKTCIAILLILVTGLTAARANDDNGLSREISTAFNKEFGNAKNISWEQKDNYAIASFTFNNQVLHAYYEQNGELNTVVHNILSDQLPVLLLAQLKNYEGYWISDLYESVTNRHSSYYVVLENADQKLTLKSVSASGWDIVKSINKDDPRG
jgi:hypothetical protein